MNQYGLILDTVDPTTHYVFGAANQVGGTPLQPDGQWGNYLPDDEVQNYGDFEPSACASFGTDHAVEALIYKVFGSKRDFSSRFLAKLSGTTQAGNSPHTVAETLRTKGTVPEKNWPFTPDINTWDKFYAPLPTSLISLATTFFEEFDFKHEWVPTDPASLKQALQYSPLGISVYAWTQDANGLYYKPQGVIDNHWVVLYGYIDGVEYHIFDSYDRTHKKLRWDFAFQQAKRYSITKTVMTPTWWDNFIAYITQIFSAPKTQAETPNTPAAPATPLIDKFCKELQSMEGWYPGSMSWHCRNPGNLRCGNDPTQWNVLALKADGGFCVFKDEATGYQALKNVTLAQCKGLSPVYNAAAHNLGLANSGELNLYQYFLIRDPAADKNDPKALAERFGRVLGADPSSFKIKQLL